MPYLNETFHDVVLAHPVRIVCSTAHVVAIADMWDRVYLSATATANAVLHRIHVLVHPPNSCVFFCHVI